MRVDSFSRLVVALALVALAFPVALHAATTVVVRQDNMESEGWTLAIQQGTSNYGANQATMPETAFSTGPGLPPGGDGSFYMRTFYSDSDPLSKIYLGTNAYTGTPLATITSLKYYTYLASRDYSTDEFSGQPPQIELTTDSGATTQQRTFVYKPWGQYGLNNVQINTWQEWDLMSPDGRWEMLHTGSSNYTGNWTWVVGRYPGLRLQEPLVGDYTADYTIVDGVYRLSNQTGTSLAIKIGSGKWLYDRTNEGAWWKESCSIRAWVDKLVIGVNGVETVYDFEAQPRPVVAATNKALKHPLIATARFAFKYVLFGRVLEAGLTNDSFIMDDGSGTYVQVLAQAHGITYGQYVRVLGVVGRLNQIPEFNSSWDNIEIIDYGM